MRSPLPPRKPKPEPKNETESFYGPRVLWRRLGEIAAANHRSKSELVVGILERWLKDYEGKKRRR